MGFLRVSMCIISQGKNSLGLMWWFLCREVLRLRGTISRELPWEIMPDLFFYRDPEEVGTVYTIVCSIHSVLLRCIECTSCQQVEVESLGIG